MAKRLKETKRVYVTQNAAVKGQKYEAGHMYNLDHDVADQLTGMNMDIPEIDGYAENVDRAVEDFKKELNKIENSNDPRYKDADFKKEAIDEAKAELKGEVDKQQGEYEQMIEQVRTASAQEAANKSDYIMDTDRRQAGIIVDQLIGELRMGHAGEPAIDKLAEKIGYMDTGRKKALALELPRAMDAAKDSQQKRLKDLYQDAKPRQSSAETFAEAAKLLPDRCDQTYQTMTLISPHFKGDNPRNSSQRNNLGGIAEPLSDEPAESLTELRKRNVK